MKIAILSDFHLGYERFRGDAYAQAGEALNKAADLADMIIIPGDIFDSRTPKPDVIAEAINIFRELAARKWDCEVTGFVGEGKHYTKVPIIAIPGTHERRAQDAVDPVGVLGLAGLVVDVGNATAIVEGGGEAVAVRGVGGIADDRFNDVVKEINPEPVRGAFNIFMFHESLYELLPFNEKFMHYDQLPKGFDLYVNGHMHNKVEERVHGKALLIPGSTVLTQLKPGEQEAKGFWLFDTKTYTYRFEKINSRRFVILRAGLSSAKDGEFVEKLRKDIDGVIKSGNGRPVIRIVVEGKSKRSADIELELNDIPRRYKDLAVIEISKPVVGGQEADAATVAESAMFERMSVRDYGLAVFIEKIAGAKVDLGNLSAAELFEILGSDANKDKAVKNALERLVG